MALIHFEPPSRTHLEASLLIIFYFQALYFLSGLYFVKCSVTIVVKQTKSDCMTAPHFYDVHLHKKNNFFSYFKRVQYVVEPRNTIFARTWTLTGTTPMVRTNDFVTILHSKVKFQRCSDIVVNSPFLSLCDR